MKGTVSVVTLPGMLYRDASLADGRSPNLRRGVSVLTENGKIVWIRDSGDEEPVPDQARIVDAGGTTIVPGLVDGHSHLTLPGGSHWIDRAFDTTETLLEVAEANADLQMRSGVRWARDVGSPRRSVEGTAERALALTVRDRWRGRRDRPYVRAAGTWIATPKALPAGLPVEAADADELLARVTGQLDDGADFVKLYLDGPDPETAPWTAAEVGRVAEAAHRRGAKVTAHASRLSGARVAAEAGIDSVEHAFELDADIAETMARNKVTVVTTLTVMRSWLTFGSTTTIDRFADAKPIRERLERAMDSVRIAQAAGVTIVGGTDFGGGSARANMLPWEFESLVESGLQPWEALASVTWRGGELLGEPDAGVIREGGPADFSLVHGDPLSDPTALWRVWLVAQ
jgi:imidazolonepropionase-like amidohydrolase